jgi:hypothetical protein
MSITPTASVISTGGGGNVFEQNVGAAFLTLLLTRSFLPIYSDSVAERLHFQAKRLNWNIDDLVIDSKSSDGTNHKLCAQIKRTFVVSAKDEECVATFTAAWRDFNGLLFHKGRDALVLIVHLGTNRLLGDFGWLLTQARASLSADDFSGRLTGDGLLNKNSKNDFETIKNILQSASQDTVQNSEVWEFLKAFFILSFDFTDATAKDEAAMKTTLQFLKSEDSPIDAAKQTWSELYVEAGIANSQGKSFDRASLPESTLRRHREVPASEFAGLARMKEHSDVVLKRVANGGARGLFFQRAETRDQISAAALSHQVVFVVGAAGGGKSVLAKKYVQGLYPSETVFAFSAEEFKVPHIDQVLAHAQVGLTWMSLKSLFPVHPKTFLIEGLERLLEGDDRGAMTDLLKAAVDDPTIKLVITCRDYHAETVERSLLRPSGVVFHRVAVPELSDADLDEAQLRVPTLEELLKSPPLRALLRNPFMLSRAAELAWTVGAPLPGTERALRRHLWNEVVKREANARGDLPNRRAESLTRISLDRAKSLQPFVAFRGDPEAITALAGDSLIVFDESKLRAAPSHDVFEDWALIEWLSSQFSLSDGDALAFAAAVSPFPALRRAYRKWLFEMLESEPAAAATYVAAVSTNAATPDYFRDDTLVAVFQSSMAENFLGQFGDMLLDADAQLIMRVIHLVRVACKTVSPLAPKGSNDVFNWHVPSGDAWPAVLKFLSEQWSKLPSAAHSLVLGFLEDWAKGISYITPYPNGAEAAGELLIKLLPVSKGGYRSGEKKRVMALVIRIPLKVEPLIRELIAKAAIKGDRMDRDPDAELFDKAIFKPFNCFSLCRDFSDEFISLCLTVWKAEPPKESEWPSYESMRDIEVAFGLSHSYEHRMFPESAIQGPFFMLLQAQPHKGVRFILDFVEDATAFYGDQNAPMDYVEPPQRASLRLADCSTKAIWCNGRLWNAHRGTAVMPGLLGCALMALEKWLLENIEHPGREKFVLSVLDLILRDCESVALISVVASVCMAHPQRTKTASLSVLGCRDFFELDRHRLVQEVGALAVGGMTSLDKMFQEERLASNKLPHRKSGLEDLARNLQFTDIKNDVWALLDFHRQQLPELAQQDDEDRLWRLALDRMDMRRYSIEGPVDDGKVLLQMAPLASDIQELIDRSASAQEAYGNLISLYVWGRKEFEDAAPPDERASDWRMKLQLIMSMKPSELADEAMFGEGARNGVAAACIRRHWANMDDSEREWCKSVAIQSINKPLSGDRASELHARNPMNGSMECGFVVPLMAIRAENDNEITTTFMAALTHFNEDVKQSTVSGVSEYVLGENAKLSSLCLWTLLDDAKRRNETEEQARTVRQDPPPSLSARLKHAFEALKASWVNATGSPDSLDTLFAGKGQPNFNDLAFDTWHDRGLATSLLNLFRRHPEEPLAEVFFEKIAAVLCVWWEEDRRSSDRHDRRDFELEHLASRSLGEYVLFCPMATAKRLTHVLVREVGEEPKEASSFLMSLLLTDDRKAQPSNYWDVWGILTTAIKDAPWLAHIDDEHCVGHPFIRDAFLNIKWADGIRSWTRLGQHWKDIDALFLALPTSTFVLHSYANYLYHIGEGSLPNAFILITRKFGDQLGESFVADDTLRWYLDALVSRCLFENLASIRKSAPMRGAMMAILDALVHAGSSIAFQLRDDFVTPTAMPNATEIKSP